MPPRTASDGGDPWGKLLLLFTTLIIVAPCMLMGLFHAAQKMDVIQYTSNSEGGEPAHPNSVLQHPQSSHYSYREGEVRKNMPLKPVPTTRCTRDEEEQQEEGKHLPPLLHPLFHQVAMILGMWCLLVSFLSPSRCRAVLSLSIMLAMLLCFPWPMDALRQHVEASREYCTTLATRTVRQPMTFFMSIPIGPFEAYSVVQTPRVETVDEKALQQCGETIYRRARFIGLVLWGASCILFGSLAIVALTDFQSHPREEDEEEVEEGRAAPVEKCAALPLYGETAEEVDFPEMGEYQSLLRIVEEEEEEETK